MDEQRIEEIVQVTRSIKKRRLDLAGARSEADSGTIRLISSHIAEMQKTVAVEIERAMLETLMDDRDLESRTRAGLFALTSKHPAVYQTFWETMLKSYSIEAITAVDKVIDKTMCQVGPFILELGYCEWERDQEKILHFLSILHVHHLDAKCADTGDTILHRQILTMQDTPLTWVLVRLFQKRFGDEFFKKNCNHAKISIQEMIYDGAYTEDTQIARDFRDKYEKVRAMPMSISGYYIDPSEFWRPVLAMK